MPCGRAGVDIYMAFYDASNFVVPARIVCNLSYRSRGLLSKDLWEAKHCGTAESSGIGHKPVPCPEKQHWLIKISQCC